MRAHGNGAESRDFQSVLMKDEYSCTWYTVQLLYEYIVFGIRAVLLVTILVPGLL